MARVKTARTTRARHKKVLKMAKGYYGAKSTRFRMAKQAVMKSLNYAYIGRRLKKPKLTDIIAKNQIYERTPSLAICALTV